MRRDAILDSRWDILEQVDLVGGYSGELCGDDYIEEAVSLSRPVNRPAESGKDHSSVILFGDHHDGGILAHEQSALQEVLLLRGESGDVKFDRAGALARNGIVAGLELGQLGVRLTGLLG